MEAIVPFRNFNDALSTLDNGGRFYNIFNHPDDQIISQPEVGKAAGVLLNKQQAILFLELATGALDESSRKDIFSKFDEELAHNYEKYKPQQLLIAEVSGKGILGSSIILEGIPKPVDADTVFKGYNMILVTNTLIPVPVASSYDVYEIRDENSDEVFVIANIKGSRKLPEQKIKVGGVLKEMGDNKQTFLEVSFFVAE